MKKNGIRIMDPRHVGVIYTQDYSMYNFGSGHPLTPKRLEYFYKLMESSRLTQNKHLDKITPTTASEKAVLRIHTQRYLNKLKELNRDDVNPYAAEPDFGLGWGDNPIFPHIYDSSMFVVGSSLAAADYLMQTDQMVFNPMGGLHHAMPERASGFCILNDAAVAIQYLLDLNQGSRVMYLDIDCHHGDGVQWIFYDRNDVLTLSFHQSGRTLFPGTGSIEENGKGAGEGYSLNFPFEPGTTDSLYIPVFEELVPKVLELYQPDFLVCQLGVDTHYTDPLTDMRLTTKGHEKLFQDIVKYAEKYVHGNLLALGGGGYSIDVVARSWTLLMGVMLNTEVKEPIPESWLNEIKHEMKNEDFSPSPLFRDYVPGLDNEMLKDPYFLQVLEGRYDEQLNKIEKELLPKIKPKSI